MKPNLNKNIHKTKNEILFTFAAHCFNTRNIWYIGFCELCSFMQMFDGTNAGSV